MAASANYRFPSFFFAALAMKTLMLVALCLATLATTAYGEVRSSDVLRFYTRIKDVFNQRFIDPGARIWTLGAAKIIFGEKLSVS